MVNNYNFEFKHLIINIVLLKKLKCKEKLF